MVAPVEADARGIIAPAAGLTRFQLTRHAPSPTVARFVDRYWLVTWDLTGAQPYTQQVLAHPVVNVVFAADGATVNGVTTRMTARTLEGKGRAFGIMFRPAGFHPFLGRALSTITDRVLTLADVFGRDADDLKETVAAAADARELVTRADRFLAAVAPRERQPCEATSEIVERVAADPTYLRVERLAAELGVSARQLQRRFASHVGIGPKALVRRYRLYEAAEHARKGADIAWATLAAQLGYSDQAHLTRDFSATIGMPPDRYARACRAAESARPAGDRVIGVPPPSFSGQQL